MESTDQSSLEQKILDHFEGKVVRKDLTSKVKGNAVVPSYVLEYLLGQYCAVNDEEVINSGIEKVKDIIKNNFVHRSENELVKATIKEKGKHKIIDKVTVTLNEKEDLYEAGFANLGISGVPVAESIVNKHKKLLSGGGVWAIMSIGYDTAEGVKSRFVVESLKPIQVSGVNVEEYIQLRSHFNTEEWINLLMHSIGLNPEHFGKRDKLIQLSRLIPFVENNYNFIELGPKGTGKSHIFSEFSPHGVLVSGGDVTSARLFVSNVGKGKIGLVGYWDVVCMDEFEQVVGSRRSDGDMVSIMQNYMANKSFNRGKETFQAYASMAFVGNTKHSVPYMLRNSHLFESIPDAYVKGAFLDRIHLYIPGWEVNILKESFFSEGFGFIVDYLAEVLRQLRKYDYSNLLDQYVELDNSYTGRDKMAVRKTFSGLVKLLTPHQEMSDEEVLELVNFAVEGRKRVKDQLYLIDETFKNDPVDFNYTFIGNGKEYTVDTLERVNYELAKENEESEVEEIEQEKPKADDQQQEKATPTQAKLKPLKEGQIIIRANQTGFSYKKLFGDHLKGAREITLQDPYIRYHYQFKNLVDFCVMLAQNKKVDDEIQLKLITWNDQDKIPQADYDFQDITTEIAKLGIHMTYEFKEIHDRFIESNNGWKIILGRGLDIFEPKKSKFDPADQYQELRKCKDCEITYLRHNP